MLEKLAMANCAVVDTFFQIEHCFYGPNGGQSNPDHVFMPLTQLEDTRRIETWLRTGRHLQLIPDTCLQDRVPLFVDFRCRFLPLEAPSAPRRLDHAAVATALHFGIGREAFLVECESVLEAAEVELDTFFNTEYSTDKQWDRVVELLQPVVTKCFARFNQQILDILKQHSRRKWDLARDGMALMSAGWQQEAGQLKS